MSTLVFKARLIDSNENRSAEVVRILFGEELLAEKEQLFRAFCKEKYSGWTIAEPLHVSVSKLNTK